MSELVAIRIRFDGQDAASHELDLSALGESLGGIARILGGAGHFAATGEYGKQQPSLAVKVLAREPQANCFTVEAVIQFAQQQQLFAGGVGAIVSAVVAWIFARASGRSQEMKAIKDSLDKAVSALAQRDEALQMRLLGTIERLADSLRPAVRSAVAPIGGHCTTLSIGDAIKLDAADKERIMAVNPDEVSPEQEWTLLLTELDLESQSAKARLDGSAGDQRIKVKITDPALDVPGNAYASALAEKRQITVRGKAKMSKGEVQTIYASDTIG